MTRLLEIVQSVRTRQIKHVHFAARSPVVEKVSSDGDASGFATALGIALRKRLHVRPRGRAATAADFNSVNIHFAAAENYEVEISSYTGARH